MYLLQSHTSTHIVPVSRFFMQKIAGETQTKTAQNNTLKHTNRNSEKKESGIKKSTAYRTRGKTEEVGLDRAFYLAHKCYITLAQCLPIVEC